MALSEKKKIYIYVYVTKNDRIIQKNLFFFPSASVSQWCQCLEQMWI